MCAKRGNKSPLICHNGQSNTSTDGISELSRNTALFKQTYARFAADNENFYQKVDRLISQRCLYPETIKERTLLSDKNKRERASSLPKVMTICIGLDIDPQISEKLLAAAGYKWNSTREQQAYRFALAQYQGRIDERNDFLIGLGFKPLGSQSRQ